MLTKYERELVNHWKNWKPGMGNFGGDKNNYKEEVKPMKVEVKVNTDKLAEDVVDRLWDIL